MARILVVDEHDSLRKGLARMMALVGHDVEEANNRFSATERLGQSQFDVVVTELCVGRMDALDVLQMTRSLQSAAAVIVMTSSGDIQMAVEAMKIGAFDFVQKPFEIEEMELKIEKAIDFRRLKHQVDYLRHTQGDIYEFDRIVGTSGPLQDVLKRVKKIARSNSTVLIRGEAGTGKALMAAAIHHNSLRANRAFVKVNCASLYEHRLESEIFGHEKGAFAAAHKERIGRLEQADGGTLFLDEVGDMSTRTQIKIMRVIEKAEFKRLGGTRSLRVDVRIIVATSRNLATLVESGQFHEDLFHRLNVASVTMPALRDRKEDIPALANSFVRRFSGELKKKVESVSPEALRALKRYNWPGNIGELENIIERAVLLTKGQEVEPDDLQIGDDASASAPDGERPMVVKIPLSGIQLTEVERQALQQALKISNWVQKDAAELVGISPRVMGYKIRSLRIELPESRSRLRREQAELSRRRAMARSSATKEQVSVG